MAPREPMNLQALDYDAAQDRRFASALLGYARFTDLSPSTTLANEAHGVCGAEHLKVTEKSGTPDMSVDVALGAAFITGTNASDQGCYWVENDAVYNVVIPTADGTNARKDLIVARVRDSAYSGSDNDLVIECVQGTAAAAPVDPAVPDDCIVLARVDVDAGVSSITNSDITDLRVASSVWARPRGALAYKASTANAEITTNNETTIAEATFSLVPGRRYAVKGSINFYANNTGTGVLIRLLYVAGDVRRRVFQGTLPVANNITGAENTWVVDTSSAETRTYRVTAQNTNGTGTLTVRGGAADANSAASYILVEDIGGYLV